MSDITVEAVVSLKLKLPPESAAIISEIVIGDRVFTPNGEHQYEIPTAAVQAAVDQLEKDAAVSAATPAKPKSKPKEANAPAKSKGGGEVTKRECKNPECGKSFTPKHPREELCSDTCRKRFAAIKQKEKYDQTHKPAKKTIFGAAGAKSDTPVGTRPLNVGDPAAPRSYARQGD